MAGVLLIGLAIFSMVAAFIVFRSASIDASYRLPGTDWVLEEHGSFSFFWGDRYPTDLTARNVSSGSKVTLATGIDVRLIDLEFEAGQLRLKLPNRSVVDPIASQFGSVRVVFDYTPRDDPADRAAYRRWVENNQKFENRRWWCAAVYTTLSPEMQKRWNWQLTPDPTDKFDKEGKANFAAKPYCPAP